MKVSDITSGMPLTAYPKFSKIQPVAPVSAINKMPVKPLIDGFEIWITNEERDILKKLDKPVRLSSLSEQEQFRIQALIRKDLVTKSGDKNPTVVANEKK
jgi:hypothetical protein